METLNLKRIYILIGTTISETFLGLFLKWIIKKEGLNMKFIVDNFLLIFLITLIVTLIVMFIYWYLKDLNEKLKSLTIKVKYYSVKFKYYDIMLTKFKDRYNAHPCSVFLEDEELFNKEEIIYLDRYLKQLNNLEIQMKGRNKVTGMFNKI